MTRAVEQLLTITMLQSALENAELREWHHLRALRAAREALNAMAYHGPEARLRAERTVAVIDKALGQTGESHS